MAEYTATSTGYLLKTLEEKERFEREEAGLDVQYYFWHLRRLDTIYEGLVLPSDKTIILDLDLDFFQGKPYVLEELPDFIKFLKFVKPSIVTIAFSPTASNFREHYSALEDRDCEKVINQVVMALELKDLEVMEVAEKRRTGRCSPK
jgi:hypothetical protein